jgi:hypothetical protein
VQPSCQPYRTRAGRAVAFRLVLSTSRQHRTFAAAS